MVNIPYKTNRRTRELTSFVVEGMKRRRDYTTSPWIPLDILSRRGEKLVKLDSDHPLQLTGIKRIPDRLADEDEEGQHHRKDKKGTQS